MYIKCVDCGIYFEFSDEEKVFFEKKGFSYPKRCKECRKRRKEDGPYVKTSSFFENVQEYGMPIDVAGGLYIEHHYYIKFEIEGQIRYVKLSITDGINKIVLVNNSAFASFMRYDEAKKISDTLSKDKRITNIELIPRGFFHRIRTD